MIGWILAVGLSLVACPALGISIAEIDDFEDGTLMNWAYADPPRLSNVATGGPAGADDNWLRLETDGVSNPGGRPVITNDTQWAGDYVANGVLAVSADLANFGDKALHIRFGIEGAGGERYVTTAAIELAADGVWQNLEFALDAADFTKVTGGTATFAEVLQDVERIRFLSRELAPDWNGDEIATVLGFDNILALPEPGTLVLLGAGLAGLARIPRRRRS